MKIKKYREEKCLVRFGVIEYHGIEVVEENERVIIARLPGKSEFSRGERVGVFSKGIGWKVEVRYV